MRRGFHKLPKRVSSTPEVRLRQIYPDLSRSYDKLQIVHDHLLSPRDMAVVAVLEDDLLSLIEECEEYFIVCDQLKNEQVESFESRSVTVLEEVRKLRFLNRRDSVLMHSLNA